MRGSQIAFFERYNYASVLEEDNIGNYEGLISLTQLVIAGFGIENRELVQLK